MRSARRRMISHYAASALLATCSLLLQAASAAEPALDATLLDENTAAQPTTPDDLLTVRDRAVEENLPVGIHAGSFLFSPGMELQTAYDDNILRTPDHKWSDVITDVKPALGIQSDWDRNAIFLGAEGDLGYFREHPQENYRDYGLLASGQYDFAEKTYLIGSVSQARRHEDFGSVTDPTGQAPVEYTSTREQAQFTRAPGAVNFTAVGTNEHVSLSSITSLANEPGGEFLTRDNRNLGGKVSYQYMPNNDVFFSADYDTTNYELPGAASLNAHGTDLRAGIDFDDARDLSGSVYAGYIYRNYEGPTSNTSDPFVGGTLNWQATPITMVSLILDRDFDESTVAGVAGVLHTTRKAVLRQSFTENVSMDISGGYDDDDFVGGEPGEDRNTHVYYAGVGSSYKLTESLGLRAEYDYQKRKSPLLIDQYQDNRVFVSMVYML